MDVFTNNMFFGIFISLIAFEIGLFIYKKTKFPLFNPLLIATILVIGFLKIFNIDLNLDNLYNVIEEQTGIQSVQYHFVIEGICTDCQK